MKEAAPHFDVFVTLDQNLQFQNPTGKHWLGIVVLSPDSTTLRHTGRSLRRFETRLGKQSPDRSTYFKFGSPCPGRQRSSAGPSSYGRRFRNCFSELPRRLDPQQNSFLHVGERRLLRGAV